MKRKLVITPQGGFPIEFEYGYICGKQTTESVGIRVWLPTENKYSAGCVLTHQDVYNLIDFLECMKKKWRMK